MERRRSTFRIAARLAPHLGETRRAQKRSGRAALRMVMGLRGSASSDGASLLVDSAASERRLCAVVCGRVCPQTPERRKKNRVGVGRCASASGKEAADSGRNHVGQFSGIHAGT